MRREGFQRNGFRVVLGLGSGFRIVIGFLETSPILCALSGSLAKARAHHTVNQAVNAAIDDQNQVAKLVHDGRPEWKGTEAGFGAGDGLVGDPCLV